MKYICINHVFLLDENDINITLLVEYVDESEVDRVSLVDNDGRTETYNFPRAGTRNARSSLKLVHFNVNELKTLPSNRRNKTIKIEDLPISLEAIYDEFEYLVRCGWYNRDVIWAQLLNRKQNKLVIVLISINNRFPAQIIWKEEQTDHWYNSHDILHFYKHTSIDENGVETEQELIVGSQVIFIWSSEISGFRHLYKVTATIVEEHNIQLDAFKNSENENSEKFSKSVMPSLTDTKNRSGLMAKLNMHQITSGNWEVGESRIWVDELRELVYFMGNKDSPVERHLYVVSTSPSNKITPRRLTKEDFTHSVALFSAKHKLCISFQSNLLFPPYSYFFRVNIPEHAPHMVNLEPKYIFLSLPDEISLEDSIDVCETALRLGPVPQLFEYKRADGELIYGCLLKPDFMEPGYKYPVYLEVYGGPGVQLVTKSFKGKK